MRNAPQAPGGAPLPRPIEVDVMKATPTILKLPPEVLEAVEASVVAARIGMIATDRHGRIIFANAAARTLLQWTELPRGAGEAFELISADHFEFAMESQTSLELESIELRRADGTKVWTRTIVTPTIINGHATGTVALIEDVTMKRRADESLRDDRQRLESQIQRRTSELIAANHELEAFSDSVSHDLRAPLRGIRFCAKILEEEYAAPLDAEAQSLLERVRREAERMSVLVDVLMDLARITSGGLNRERVDLTGMSLSMAADYGRREPGRAVDFDVKPDMSALADSRMVRIVLENLLNNAWKYSSKRDHTKIEIGTVRLQSGETAFFVRDNGVGFDMARSERLFQPFQRLHADTEFEGTGIGLATVGRIVRRHGGRIWAESAPDAGATFFFTFADAASGQADG